MTKNIILFITSLVFVSCNGQNLKEKSIVLQNQTESLLNLSKVANVIDDDTESYWAYKYADSTLSTIDKSGKSYYKDLNKIYTAYSYIFYGMSYTRTVMAISRGDDYSFEELNQTIIQTKNDKIIDLSKIAINEMSSIQSVINFYKVSRMERYGRMQNMFENSDTENKNIFDNHSQEQAYRIVSLNNKKLFFKIFAGLIIDIYSINNQDVDDITFNNYAKSILKQGEKMDEIPSDIDKINALNDAEYYTNILKSSKVQKSMLNQLISEIKILKQRNQ
jgi:hypothetical protein